MAKWNLNTDHTTAAFSIRHLNILNIRGMFNSVKGVLTYNPGTSGDLGLEAVIDAKSVDTGTADRDAHLRSPAFFDVDKFPEITFRSTDARLSGTNGTLSGDLTIHGVTRNITLEVVLSGPVVAPPTMGRGTVLGIVARTTINRKDFGIDLNIPMEEGGVVMAWEVEVILEGEADLVA
ncbi:MAG: YceI family protein [Deltaproteobacteria bacterium]